MNVKTGLIAVGFALMTGITFGQKKVETDAVMAYKSFENALQSGDMENAKKSLLKAKSSIDEAAANPETSKSPKTLFYKGEIYASMLIAAPMINQEELTAAVPKDAKEQAIQAYKDSYNSSTKFHADIKNSVAQIQTLLLNTGSAAYEKKMFKEATQAFAAVNDFTSIINVTDTLSIYYAGICAESDTNWVEAAKYYRKCADLNYKPDVIYRTTAIAYIRADQKEEALHFLKEAINKAPKDKHLYFALGTIAMDMNDDELVETNLKKAYEIDPKYADAYYNLGSYFSSKGLDLRQKSNDLPPNAKQEADEMLSKSLEFYKMALTPLEKYVELQPKDAVVLLSLVKICRALQDKDKEAKYMKMLDEAKK